MMNTVDISGKKKNRKIEKETRKTKRKKYEQICSTSK